MGLGVYFAEDIARMLRGIGEGVNLLVQQRGLHDAADVAYVAGYRAALQAVATSFGLQIDQPHHVDVLDVTPTKEKVK